MLESGTLDSIVKVPHSDGMFARLPVTFTQSDVSTSSVAAGGGVAVAVGSGLGVEIANGEVGVA
jgi:hypothetical protein